MCRCDISIAPSTSLLFHLLLLQWFNGTQSCSNIWRSTLTATLVYFLVFPLFKHLVPTELVFWPLQESIMYIYGYGRAFSINHCSFSRLRTSASSACSMLEQDGAESACVFTQAAGTTEDKQWPVREGQRPQKPQESWLWHGRPKTQASFRLV